MPGAIMKAEIVRQSGIGTARSDRSGMLLKSQPA
jgi:hypothetical protein